MQIYLLHGEDVQKRSQRLQEIVSRAKKDGLETVRIDSLEQKSFKEAVSSESLFAESTLFIADISLVSAKDFLWLAVRKKDDNTLVMVAKKSLSKDFLKKLPEGVKIEEFKLSENIFKFLDSFYPGNAANCLKLFHQIIKQEPAEKIIHFLGRHLRDLYWVGQDPKGLKYQDWRILKMASQSKKFQKGQLERVIGLLAEADVLSKTSDGPAAGLLDQIIAAQLE